MKILQVTPFFSPRHGGSAEVPYQLSRELARRGHEVTVYTSDYKLSREYLDALTGVRVIILKSWLSWVKFHITPAMVKSLRENISRFDIIHMHNYFTFQNMVAHYYARKHHIPYVLQAHGSVATYFQRGLLKRIFHRLWGYRILKDAARLIAATPLEARQYQSLGIGKDKIEIIPNGLDLSEFSDLPPGGEFRREYGLADNQKLVLYLGRIDKLKGLDLLARAFAVLSREMADARLVIVGPDDGYLPELKKLVKEFNLEPKVLFTGPLHGREKLRAYVDADVYVLPSSYEIFGITVLEALACGTPVIVTDRCGIADYISSDWGYVIQFDENQLKEAISKTLSTKRSYKENSARKFIEENFTWSKTAGRIEKLYESAIRQ